MTTEVREIEQKYEVEGGVALPSFADLPRVATVSEPEQETLNAEYYDTDDLRLLKAGITLRRREGGSDEGWHLKLPNAAAGSAEKTAGASLAEIALDEVSAQSLGASTTLSRWNELEIELTGGRPRLLRAAAERLRRRGLRPADRSAKLERALAVDARPARRGHSGGPAGAGRRADGPQQA